MRACTEGEVGSDPVRHPPSAFGSDPQHCVVGEASAAGSGLGALGFIPAGAAEVQGAAAAGNELVKMKKGHK